MRRLPSSYFVGWLRCKTSDVGSVVAALNLLRKNEVVLTVNHGRIRGDELSVPVALRTSGDGESDRDCIASILDNCAFQWSRVSVRATDLRSIELAHFLDAVDMDLQHLLVDDDILPKKSRGDPFAGMVGIEQQIDQVRDLAGVISAYGDVIECRNMCLLGGPGGGKTEFAKRSAKLFGDAGITNGRYEYVSAAELISSYVGDTPKRVSEAFDRASGGTLFIDEAYSLTDGMSNNYGVEAVNALVERMDERRHEVIVIAAGYPDKMRSFLDSNPGLASRFPIRIAFDGYTSPQLSEIFKTFARNAGFSISSDAGLVELCDRLKKGEDFSQGRTMRNLFDQSVLCAYRSHPKERCLNASDITKAGERILTNESDNRLRIGFA